MQLDRICNYSTIIFAANVWVLLVVAFVTDYWEYRGFTFDDLTKEITPTNTTDRFQPPETKSYFVIRYYWEAAAARTDYKADAEHFVEEIHDQPPSLLHKYYTIRNVTRSVEAGNSTLEETVEVSKPFEEKIFLYFQYGNLFRDCDDLEAGSRDHLGLIWRRGHRCSNFIINSRRSSDYIAAELPAVIHLERCAFILGALSVLASSISLMGGCYGCLTHDKSGLIVASAGAVASAVLLTLCIAVFHAKCHLIHRHEFMSGINLPYKRLLDDSRTHVYGWSFMLAWLCVVMLLVQGFVWLSKAQDYGNSIGPRAVHSGVTCLHENLAEQEEQVDLLYEVTKQRNGIKDSNYV